MAAAGAGKAAGATATKRRTAVGNVSPERMAELKGHKRGTQQDPTFDRASTEELGREMRRADRAQSQPYKEQYERDEAERTELDAKRAKGRAASSSRRVRQARPTNILRGRRVVAGGSAPQEGAGLLLGLILYALASSYIRYGPAGVRGWFAAKFINKPFAPAAGSTPNAATPHIPTAAPPAKGSSSQYPSPQVVPL